MAKHGFILRIAPSRRDRVPEALERNQLIAGWAKAAGLLDPDLKREGFRAIIQNTYHPDADNLRKAGRSAGSLWRFLRTMEIGDLVVVPHKSEFYVGEIEGDPVYDETKVDEDSAYRRPVKWLNGKRAIPRASTPPALAACLKTQLTCVDATDLVTEIEDCLERAQGG